MDCKFSVFRAFIDCWSVDASLIIIIENWLCNPAIFEFISSNKIDNVNKSEDIPKGEVNSKSLNKPDDSELGKNLENDFKAIFNFSDKSSKIDLDTNQDQRNFENSIQLWF